MTIRAMTLDEFLSHLRGLDVRIWADGDRLRLDAPKEVLTPELRAELAERKAEILVFLREHAAIGHSPPPPIEPVSRDETLPLSFGQQWLWFLDQVEPDNPYFNTSPIAVRLTGQLNVAALERSFDEIARRHEVLRTTFASKDGSPVQVIAPASSMTLPLIDLSELPQPEREEAMQHRVREEARRPFDLERGPVWRVEVMRLGP